MITLFEPMDPNGAIAIYHEGHGGESTEIGAETISWLLQRGWSVVSLNLPRVAHMALRDSHSEEDNPLWRMLYGIAQVTQWIHRSWAPDRDPVVVAIGRSGGGWASLLYAALDQRIDATVVVSGFVPVSERLSDQFGRNVGDWEQMDPTTLGVLDYTDLVRLASTRDLLLTYSELDDCCFRLSSADPFAQWLVNPAQVAPGQVTTVISSTREHGLSSDGYVALQTLLDRTLSRGQ
jgi:pimeloyl-ACP methyl ester carboxylesterase